MGIARYGQKSSASTGQPLPWPEELFWSRGCEKSSGGQRAGEGAVMGRRVGSGPWGSRTPDFGSGRWLR